MNVRPTLCGPLTSDVCTSLQRERLCGVNVRGTARAIHVIHVEDDAPSGANGSVRPRSHGWGARFVRGGGAVRREWRGRADECVRRDRRALVVRAGVAGVARFG